MYTVIGQDNSEYGPADVATLAQWARMGRVGRDTIVVEVGTGRRLTAGQIRALAHLFPAPPPLPLGFGAPAQAARPPSAPTRTISSGARSALTVAVWVAVVL
ncbi:MAG TPA: hypothetical protein VKT77_20830, partial [Chthonomonadaceae bacterium]|nr:hypothetical protein [Chthonomonadaceae bacterium]